VKRFLIILAAILLLVLIKSTVYAETYTLQTAVEQALANNSELAAARESIAESDGVVTEAWSNVLPKVSVEGGYTHISEVPEINFEGPDLPTIPGIGEIPKIEVHQKMGDEDNYKVEGKINQLLFASGQAYSGIKMAQAGRRASEFQIAAKEDELAAKVAEAFYGVLFAQEVLTAKAEALATSEAHLADVTNKHKFGSASRFELLRSEVETANLRPEVDQARNRVDLAKTGLKTLLGAEFSEPIEVTGDLSAIIPVPDAGQAKQDALTARDEFAGLDAAIEAQRRGTWVATANMLPKAVLFGTYGYQKPWYFESEDWTDIWTVGVGVSVPLFDGLSGWGKRQQFSAKKRQFEKQKIALTDGIEFTIEQSALDLSEIKGRIGQTRDNVARAKEAQGMAENAYKNGVATNLEVLDAQLALTGSQTRYIQALYDYQIARTRLLSAAGLPLF
jgi:outer membrane protein